MKSKIKRIRNVAFVISLFWVMLMAINLHKTFASTGNTYSLYIGGAGTISDNSINEMKKVITKNKLIAFPGNKYSVTYSFDQDGSVGKVNSKISSAYKSCTLEDLAIFFYNGHGMTNGKNDIGLALGNNKYYSYPKLAKKLNSIKCKRMIVIIDACYAGAFYDLGVKKLSVQDQKKFILYLSSAREETSQYNGNYSRYSMAIAEGLGKNGIVNADMLNKDGTVTAEELSTYVNLRMKDQLLAHWPDVNPKHYSANKNFSVYEYNPLTINKTSSILYTEKNTTLQLNVKAFKKTIPCKWKSSDTSVAAVSSTGKVTAKKKGTATIFATALGNTVKCKIKVVKPSIKLNKTSATVKLGTSTFLQLKATVVGKSKAVTWKSSNPSIASVDKKGKVTAKKSGTTTITATANGVTAKCIVQVIAVSYNIYGTWEIDTDLTMNKNGVSMRYLFGSGFKYENRMNVDKNGSLSYWVGIGYGGKGTYSYKNNKIVYSVEEYEGEISNGTMSVSKISGKVYIVQNCKDFFGDSSYKLYWRKK